MARYIWKTSPSGYVIVTDDTGVDNFTPTLTGNNARLMDKQVIERWANLAENHASRVGVPAVWILGMIFRESGGNPKAFNGQDNPPGIGLMQITNPALYRGLTRDQVFDPDTNIRIGANLNAALTRMVGFDLPRVASGYNAGLDAKTHLPHPSSKSPWGMLETPGHILAVVSASNYALTQGIRTGMPDNSDTAKPLLSDEEIENVKRAWFDLTAVARDAIDENRESIDLAVLKKNGFDT
jgi:soluble lytic murein transglycosylase-like protein